MAHENSNKPNRTTQLARAAASPDAAEGVLKGLWEALGLDEKGACSICMCVIVYAFMFPRNRVVMLR